MEEIITKKAIKDKVGMTIPKGTHLYVEKKLTNPMTKKEELIVLVDNGTGQKNLMPKTIFEKEKL